MGRGGGRTEARARAPGGAAARGGAGAGRRPPRGAGRRAAAGWGAAAGGPRPAPATPVGRLRVRLRRLFYGHRPAAVAFQVGLLAEGFAAVAYLLRTTLLHEGALD